MHQYILSDSEVQELVSCNRPGAVFIPCNLGEGVGISVEDLALPNFATHAAKLDSIFPLASRTQVVVQPLPFSRGRQGALNQ